MIIYNLEQVLNSNKAIKKYIKLKLNE